MNVVFLPALASSLVSAVGSSGALCIEGPCLLGWAWTIAALMLLSAWLVRRWPDGGEMARRLQSAGASVSAIAPQPTGLASPTRQAPARPRAVLAATGLALRAPPTTDMAAAPPGNSSRPAARRSLPSPRPLRSPGTPSPVSSGSCDDDGPGQPSPA